LLWLKAVGLEEKDIARKSGEDVPRVTVAGYKNLWTLLYSEWILARWTEWARLLGYKDHRAAGAEGHTDAEFDTWLGGWKL
jgi:hypothetical protein